MTVNDDDIDIDEATRNASMLQNKQLLTTNVLIKRKDQLRRWESSEMNAASVHRPKRARVRFQDADVFLSACMSGDEDEVDELLGKGADINTATMDGLTALHQAVIDSKPEMVEYLIRKGAAVNAQDNEGWTPLHAAACCGNLVIIKMLVQKGADLEIINSDGELPLDLVEDEACKDYLSAEYRRQNVDLKKCREAELTTIMNDAQRWYKEGKFGDRPHTRTGGWAMHVAAGKGYTEALELLIKAGGNVKCRDKDGWTPLHAAAHWGERDSCKILMENNASIKDLSFSGQDVLSVADKDIVEYLEELEKTADLRRSNPAPSVPSANILQDKKLNNIHHHHEEHTITSEHKRELQHRDQSSERDMMFSSLAAKVPRLAEKTPSETPSSHESSEERMSNESASTGTTPSSESNGSSASTRLSEERMSVSDRSSSEKTSSMERSPSQTSASTAATSSPGSSSVHSGDQHVSCTVVMPRPLQPATSWIQRGVPLRSNSSSSASMRSGFVPSGSEPPYSGASSMTTSSVASTPTSSSSASSAAFNPSTSVKAPWQPAGVSATNESEAERRSTARLQRQSRRSTQGVTKEQLEEVARLAAEDNAKRRGTTGTLSSVAAAATSGTSYRENPHVMARLASEERDSSMSVDRNSDIAQSTSSSVIGRRNSDRDSDRTSPTTNANSSLCLPNALSPSSTPSAANFRRTSKGMPLSRSNRRGTGPVLPEDIPTPTAAVSQAEPTSSYTFRISSSTLNNNSGTMPVTTGRPVFSSVSRVSQPETVMSMPSSSSVAASAPSTGLRSAPPTSSGRPPITSVRNVSAVTASTSHATQHFNRPTETNLNYKALYEKERQENERLRKEIEDMRKGHENRPSSLSTFRAVTSRFQNGSASSPTLSKSPSSSSVDDERRALERKIADLELQIKTKNQLAVENQRLKEENCALVRVISKMTN